MIVTRAPFRISFAGGGTDLPSFYEQDYGAVLSTAINKYVYVIVNQRSPLFGQGIDDPSRYRIRLSYSSTESVEHAHQLQHPIAREVLRFLDLDTPMDIATMADVPAGSGLGSSSTFAVALLQALHAFKGEDATPDQLAEEAAHIEIDVLKRPVGKQDHYASAFGGMNMIRFLATGDVSVRPIETMEPLDERLFPYLMMLYTGIHRDAGAILTEQKQQTAQRGEELTAIRKHAHQLEELVVNGFDPVRFGQILHETWLQKRNLTAAITNDQIDQWYARARAAGAVGGKVCGAGGGGFLLLVVMPASRAAVREALYELHEMDIQCEPRGSTVMLSDGEVACLQAR